MIPSAAIEQIELAIDTVAARFGIEPHEVEVSYRRAPKGVPSEETVSWAIKVDATRVKARSNKYCQISGDGNTVEEAAQSVIASVEFSVSLGSVKPGY